MNVGDDNPLAGESLFDIVLGIDELGLDDIDADIEELDTEDPAEG